MTKTNNTATETAQPDPAMVKKYTDAELSEAHMQGYALGLRQRGNIEPDPAMVGDDLPVPSAWRYRPKDGLRHPAYTEREAQALAYDANPEPLFTIDQMQEHASKRVQPDSGEDARLNRIAWLIGSIFVHGDFKAETHNEKELEALLRGNGTFWDTLADFDAAMQQGGQS